MKDASRALSGLIAELARSPSRPVALARPGQRIGRFELVRELGRGGFGTVYEARDAQLHRSVALKVIRPGRSVDSSSAELLQREATAIAQLKHPNIVTLYDAGAWEGGPYLVMELLHGETLATALGRGAPPDAVGIAIDIARALAHAHAQGVLHRDVKPSNVFLERDAVKMLDFGLAHVFGVAGPAGSGTPGYMAPEQRRGEPEDARTDVFAAGVVLGEMLARAGPGSHPELARLAARCADDDAARRPRDGAALLDELLAIREAGARKTPVRLDAVRSFVLADEAARRPVYGQQLAAAFRDAAQREPSLAAAHWRLAAWLRRFGGSRDDQRAALQRAQESAGEGPSLERALIEALAHQLEGRTDEAMAAYARAAETWPDDPRPAYEAGDLLRHGDDLDAALPWFERAVDLDPEDGWAAAHLVEALAATGRIEALRRRVSTWEGARSCAALHALALAYGWLGDLSRGRDAARRGALMGCGLVSEQDDIAARVFAGEYASAARDCETLAADASPVRKLGTYALAAMDAYQGRRRAGLARLEALPEKERDAIYHALRADYLLGDGDVAAVRQAVDVVEALDPSAAWEHAPSLALLGDAERASSLARCLPPDSPPRAVTNALLGWHAGDRDGALSGLASVVARAPISAWRVAPLYLYGDLAARAGRHAEAISALERFRAQYLPRMMWRSWALPRALLTLARSYDRLGERGSARARLDALLEAWAPAERDQPLLAEALGLDGDLRQPGTGP